MNNHRTFIVFLAVSLLATTARAAEDVPLRTDLWTAGEGGYAHYRIPGVVVTRRGTVLAYCEARASLAGDWGKTDLLLRRSADGGRTWEPARLLVPPPPKELARNPVAIEQKLGSPDEITANNPVMIADPVSGVVHVLWCVDYGRCFYRKSDDDGQTFSEPREITGAFEAFRERYAWRVLATGPGHGIRLSKTGRLVVPIWLSTGTGGHGHRPSCVATIYSDDAGQTWHAGDVVVDHPKLTNPSETAVAELSDARVMLNIRHEGDPKGPSGKGGTTWRAVVIGPDGATGWGEPRLDRALPDPVCMASLLSLGGGRLLFVNPVNETTRERKNLTLRVSRDDGQTWPDARVIEPGTAGYSDLAATRDGRTVFCFYERGVAAKSRPRGVGALTLARIELPAEDAR